LSNEILGKKNITKGNIAITREGSGNAPVGGRGRGRHLFGGKKKLNKKKKRPLGKKDKRKKGMGKKLAK